MNHKHDRIKTAPTQKIHKQNLPQKMPPQKDFDDVIQRMENEPSSLQYDDIIQLQKTVGNEAVSNLFVGNQTQSTPPISLGNFLQRNTPNMGVIQRVFKSEKEIRKEKFVEEAKEKGITDPKQIEALYTEARKGVVEEDPVTKFELGADREPTIKRAIEYVGSSMTEQAFYIEVDVRNLGGINDKLGIAEGRKILFTASQIAQKYVRQLGGNGFVGSFHHGGDEFCFVIVGEVDLETLEAKLTAAEYEFAEINDTEINGIAVRNVVHLKHPSQYGTGIAWGVSAITAGSKVGEVLSTADQIIELKKSINKLLPQSQATEDDLIEDPSGDQSQSQIESSSPEPSKKKKKMTKLEVKETQNFYKRMIKSYSLQPKDVGNGAILKAALSNYPSFSEDAENARSYIYEQIKAIGSLKYTLRRKKGTMKSEEELKEDEFVKFAKEQGLEDDKIARELFKSARSDNIDPVTGFEPQSSVKGTVDAAVKHLEAMSEHRGVYVSAKLKNLAGLNHIMGANGTNTIFAKIANTTDIRLRNELSQDGLHISDFREKGSKFSFVIVGRVITEGLVSAVLQKVAMVISKINAKKIKNYNAKSEFAENTIGEKVIHPKKAKQKGTGLAFGVSAISPDGSAESIISAAQELMKSRDT